MAKRGTKNESGKRDDDVAGFSVSTVQLVRRSIGAKNPRLSWSFLKSFGARQIPVAQGWDAIWLMREKARKALAPTERRYHRCQNRWKQRLRAIGGDPSSLVLEKFRPLRLSREEDWSSWLAWLLETSTKGVLARTMFGLHMNCPAASLRLPKVELEPVTLNRERRGDIKLTWKSRQVTNIEVKIWDKQFGKTFETNRKLRAQEPASAWRDFILIPDTVMVAWNDEASDHVKEGMVNVILWGAVVRGCGDASGKG